MSVSHTLGFPRIGNKRQLKFAVEAYWQGKITQQQLLEEGQQVRASNWQTQQQAGLDYIPVGDFAWYDHVLNHSLMFGAIPERFGDASATDIDTLFRMARGQAPSGQPAAACEMTKWFNTNYHYIVPELKKNQTFKLDSTLLLAEVKEALALRLKTKPVLLGPLTWLWLGKIKGEDFDKLSLLDDLVPLYASVLSQLSDLGIEWVQIDEPILSLDLPPSWQQAFEGTYNKLQAHPIKTLLTTYYGPLGDNLGLAVNLPVDGLHVDLVEGKEEITPLLDRLPRYKVLSAGVVNGRNIWRADLTRLTDTLATVRERLEDRLWVSSSCSLLHSPVDLDSESDINHQTRSWLAFAKQKCTEIAVLTRNINGTATAADKAALTDSDLAVASKAASSLIHKPAVQGRVSALTESMTYRATPFKTRKPLQKEKLDLPLYPTTTIGSFPQTADIRRTRRQFKKGEISLQNYETAMEKEIQTVLQHQEALGLDVLVHGEPERNDMVEYFGEQLDGFLFTGFGWVQSYGSRCVKPPIILGDIERPAPMTVKWSQFAQQQTSKPVKGMLTGPVTILRWSFPREDIDQSQSCLQLALALRDEVVDLESAGIDIIQIDEPAIREGLPLRKKDWATYLDWAVKSFRVSAGGVKDSTQIHTHMCYSDFNEIIEYIAAMDADVISIEASRSDMELLNAFEQFHYPNDIGPGVYDIHSPNVPESSSITTLMQKAAEHLPPEQLWVNPDCGLKTRSWPEVDAALKNMVAAAKTLRSCS